MRENTEQYQNIFQIYISILYISNLHFKFKKHKKINRIKTQVRLKKVRLVEFG